MKKFTKYCLLIIGFIAFFGSGFIAGKMFCGQDRIENYSARIYDGKMEIYSGEDIHVLGDVQEMLNNDPFYAAQKDVGIIPEGYVAEAIPARGEVFIEEPVYYSYSSGGSYSGGGSSSESPAEPADSEPVSGDGQDIQWSNDML